MCGIVGIFGAGAGNRERELAHMLSAVRSRGEVDETYFSTDMAVGTRRLKIVDRDRAAQPIFNEQRDKLIMFNGEIFNYKQLKRELEAEHSFRTDSDTETILHAYEAYGAACVQRLEGQFAFVIYDIKNRRVFAARDHIGIIPLYFVAEGQDLYIASIIKALTFLNRPIHVVPPGHTMDLRGHLTTYYRPAYGGTALTRTECVGQLKQAIQAAIAKRIDTDLPVGVIYSGGIDSSIVLHEVSKAHADVTAFTIGTPSSEDLAISRRFCAERKIRQVVIPLTHKDITRADIRRAIAVTELNEYLDIINAVISLPLFKRIHEERIKIVLGGDGSDELFGGYDMYQQITDEDAARLFLYKLMTLHKTELQRVDRCSMAFEVEVRVPFLDLRVVELALQMPREWKIKGGVEKWVVREAFRDELPDYIVKRRKNPLSYSSGLHERVRMYKILFARYYRQQQYSLHEPMKMDFSYLLTKNRHDVERTIAEERLARDYSTLELVKEALKAGVRTYLAPARQV